MSNTDVILRMYEYFGKGDLDRIRDEVFHDDIVWNVPGHHPLSGRIAGTEEVIEFFDDLSEAGLTIDNVHFGELDDGTVVEKHHASGSDDGTDYAFPTVTLYAFKDGKIREVQVHTADQHGVDRYMWSRLGRLKKK